MTDTTAHRTAQPTARHPEWGAFLLGLAIFGLLWILYIPFRQIYVPTREDIPALADAMLLAPGARWQDWFTRGYSNFWDVYPEWPYGVTEFTRPAFQLLIYLAHFALGTDWASYQVINSFALAGMGAVAFYIANTVLGLRTGLSLLAAVLVVLSPPVVDSWVLGLAFAIEPLATLLVAGAFLAVLTRRDFLCLTILFLALLTKENTVWAPLAAAITVMLRPKPDESLRRRALTAVVMFLPVVMWLGLRFAFFGGIGGTYVTAGYTPLVNFIEIIFYKLRHIHYLFIIDQATLHGQSQDWRTAVLILDRGTALLVYALLFLWALRILLETVNRLRFAMHEMRWPTVDSAVLVTLWAAIALAFHFALPLSAERYATSVVMFAWPALVAEVEKSRIAIFRLGLAVCCVVALIQTSSFAIELIEKYTPKNATRGMGALLQQVPAVTRQIYVLSAGGLQRANPEYVRLVLGVSAEIVRVADMAWECGESNDLVSFDHSTADGVVNMTVTLPACAHFYFSPESRFHGPKLTNGRIYRSDTMSYEVPEADPQRPTFDLGRTMTVHVRPNGPARFIIEHGGPNQIAWFDTP